MCSSKKKKKENRTIGERYYAGELAFPFQFEDFDCPTPEKMPRHFFPRVKKLDYSSAIKADVPRVRMSASSVIPRCWYIDAWFDCEKCGKEYCCVYAGIISGVPFIYGRKWKCCDRSYNEPCLFRNDTNMRIPDDGIFYTRGIYGRDNGGDREYHNEG